MEYLLCCSLEMLCLEQSEGRFCKRGICMKIAGRRSVICRAAHKQQTSHAAAAEFHVCTPNFSALGAKKIKTFRGLLLIIPGMFMTPK